MGLLQYSIPAFIAPIGIKRGLTTVVNIYTLPWSSLLVFISALTSPIDLLAHTLEALWALHRLLVVLELLEAER
jgi:hypothetical protein